MIDIRRLGSCAISTPRRGRHHSWIFYSLGYLLFDGLDSSHWPILKENLIFAYEIVGSLFKEC